MRAQNHWLLVVSLLVLGAIAWIVFGTSDEPAAFEPESTHRKTPKPTEPAAASESTAENRAIVETPVIAAGPEQAHNPSAHPHPITDKHKLLAHERAVIQSLNDAMDRKDPEAMRPIITEYRNNHHEDPNAMQSGYEVIADCLQYPGPESTARAKQYYKEERASTLRRFVRRHCFDGKRPTSD